MESSTTNRKAWTTPELRKFRPEAELVDRILAENGVVEVPPALRHLALHGRQASGSR